MAIPRRARRMPLWLSMVLASAGFVAAATLIHAVIGQDGVLELHRVRRRAEVLAAEVEDLQQKKALLESQARSGADDLPRLEQVAREKLGLVKEGEVVYVLRPEGEVPPPRPPKPEGTVEDAGKTKANGGRAAVPPRRSTEAGSSAH